MINPFEVYIGALGHVLPSEKILNAVVEVGAGFVESAYIEGDGFYWKFLTEGVEFNFREKILIQISIYMKPMDGYSAFVGIINSGFDQNRLIKIFGQPNLLADRREDAVFGFIRAHIVYLFMRYKIRFEFDNDGSLTVIHLTHNLQ